MKKIPDLGFWKLWNISFGFFGVQIAYALQSANTTRTFSFYATGGGTIDKSVSGKLEQDFIVQKEKIYSSTENLKIKPFQFSIHAALGIQYNINPTLGAFIEPGAAFYFKDGSFKNTIRDKHPLHFNLQLGVRWNY